MKSVEAWIAPSRLDDIAERLRLIGVPGMTVQVVREAYGPTRQESYRGTVLSTSASNKLHLKIAVTDDMAEGVINAITTVVRRDPNDDGWIFVTPMDEAIRIRTDERGADAL